MLLDICLGSKAIWRILSIYGETPGARFTREDLRKHTHLGNKALSSSLKRLASCGILAKVKTELARQVYELNADSEYAGFILQLLKKERSDLRHLPYDIVIITREFSRMVIDSTSAESIYLFGSTAKGTYRKESDMDFAIVVEEKNPKEDMIISQLSELITKKYNKKIQYFLITAGQIKEGKRKTELIEEIIKHGIKLI